MMDIKRIKNYLYWLYWQFKIITMVYLMEPIELWVFYTVLLVFAILTTYFVWVIIPHWSHLILEHICYLLDLQEENPVSTIIET